jgi:hypothetical protein
MEPRTWGRRRDRLLAREGGIDLLVHSSAEDGAAHQLNAVAASRVVRESRAGGLGQLDGRSDGDDDVHRAVEQVSGERSTRTTCGW